MIFTLCFKYDFYKLLLFFALFFLFLNSVFSLKKFRVFLISIFRKSSQSIKIGLALRYFTALAVAIKLIEGTITS